MSVRVGPCPSSAELAAKIAAQAAAFEKEGGFTERLHRIRSRSRGVKRS